MSNNDQLECIEREPQKTATHSVIWLHGLGADGNDFADLPPQLNLPDELQVRFIFPHAPIRPVTINAGMQMRAWFDVYNLQNIDREDEEGLAHAQQAVNQLIKGEMDKGIASENIVLAGFSQGGALSLYAGLQFPHKLAGILALSCYLPQFATAEQRTHHNNKDTAIFIAHGVNDPIVPFKAGKITCEILQEHQHPVEWFEYPMEHSVCQQEISDISSWLQRRFIV